MKNLIGVFVTIGVAGAIIFLLAKTNIAPEAKEIASVLTASETTYDFGSISMAAGKVNREFRVVNSTQAPVTIAKVYSSCMCTVAELSVGGKKFGPFGMLGHGVIPKVNSVLDVGQEAMVKVIFDPAAHGPAGVGPIQRTVFVEDAAGGMLQLHFSANVTP